MYAWTEGTKTPNLLGDQESIFSIGSPDFTVRSTIINMEDKETKGNNCRSQTCSADVDRRSFADRFREFANSTTFHGISNVTNSKHNGIRRLFWSLIVIGVSSWLVTGITQTVIEFFKYPVTSAISINYVDSMTFPAVTICNFNQFRRSVIPDDQVDFINKLYGLDPEAPTDLNISDFEITGLTRDQYEDLFAAMSHQLETMLSECVWRSSETCTVQNFTRRFTDHGICFTFNDPKNGSEILQVNSAGTRNGLFLRLYADTEEYMFSENTAAGFRMLLHPQGVAPLVKELGFSVSPGFESSISVRQTLVESLPQPYESNCTNSTLRYSDTYTVPSCRFECKVEYVVDKCGCRDYRWPGPAPICNPQEQFKCVYPQEAEFLRQNVECSCPVSCETKTYESRISLGYWPAGHVTEFVEAHMNLTEEYVRKNYLDVYIFFEELMYLKIEQKEAYSTSSLQSNIGGYMGLLCGMSLITVLEWADFTLVSIIRRFRSRKE
ncbi:acid-sensing ion channel 1C-like [Acanthaster planci]|uniref:Acid-sensing ion channel 1C-like n=1 Tax=Acanthaster planci TaxID=133434 RepID=A0A8B7ZBM6_ACAPL|nr:acid-sensing ion channel 1C-like [Acanthaster planci]